MKTNETVWLVISRDKGVLAVYKSRADAWVSAREWEIHERMGGGSPSVWVKEFDIQ